jgi:Domain of unknown function (DUF4266)
MEGKRMTENDGNAPRATGKLGMALFGLAVLGACLGSAGCATVRPEQRAVLADPLMQFNGDATEQAALEHALENREGSSGAGSVRGGGCGCN